MQYTITKLPNSQIQFQITAPADTTQPFFDKAIAKLAVQVKLDGFRPGKAPAHIVRDAIGEPAILMEAQELALQDTYYEMVQKEGIIPTGQPVEVAISAFSTEDGLSWSGTVDVVPDIDAKKWRDVVKDLKPEQKINEIEASEEEIENTLKELQNQLARTEAKEGVVAAGDFVRFDLDAKQGSDDRVTPEMCEQIRSKGISAVIGDGRFIPGFEDNMIGLKKGETREFELQFPDDYKNTDLAGKKVIFVVSILEIEAIVMPELNDAFAAHYGISSFDEMKKMLTANIVSQKKQDARSAFEQHVMVELTKKIAFEVPQSLIAQEQDLMLNRFRHDLEQRQGIPFEQYLEIVKKTEVEIRESLREQAETNVRIGLVLGQITKDEGVDVSEQEITASMTADLLHAEQHAGDDHHGHGHSHDPEEIKRQYADEQFVQSLKNSIRGRKSIDMILDATAK